MKIEYCELEVIIGGPISGVKGELTYFYPDGKHKRFEGNYGQIMAGLGIEGWKLVASSARIESGLSNKHKIDYVFMREVPTP